jgi:transmembrane sensor
MTDKGRILVFPDAAAIEAEAAAWVARFDAGAVSARDQAVFQEWLNRSALHRETIAEYGNLWSEFDALKPLAGGDAAGPTAGVQDGRAGRLKRAGHYLVACAAVMLVVAGGTATFYPQIRKLAASASSPPIGSSYETAVGGNKRIALADGSTVILNTNSKLDIDFSGNRRDVHLVRGEAFFEVVHDKARPFTVYANNYMVRDIGTAFDVHLSRTGIVEVGVTKGSVEVAPADTRVIGTAKSPRVLVAGQNVILDQKVEPAKVVSSDDMSRKLAWRQGQLIYTGQPLKEVLADISRYSDIRIELANPDLENLPVGGAFRTDQIEAIFAALERNFGVQAEWTDTQHVRLTASPEKTSTKD